MEADLKKIAARVIGKAKEICTSKSVICVESVIILHMITHSVMLQILTSVYVYCVPTSGIGQYCDSGGG